MFSHLNFTISFTYRLYGEQIFIEISVVTVGNVVFSREEKSVSLIKAKVTVGCFSACEVTAHVDPRRLPNLVIRIVNFLPFQKWTHNWSRTLFTWQMEHKWRKTCSYKRETKRLGNVRLHIIFRPRSVTFLN